MPAYPYHLVRPDTPTGIWLAARTSPDKPYPCRCGSPQGCERVTNPSHCPCWGRVDDLSHLPQRCCAVRAAART